MVFFSTSNDNFCSGLKQNVTPFLVRCCKSSEKLLAKCQFNMDRLVFTGMLSNRRKSKGNPDSMQWGSFCFIPGGGMVLFYLRFYAACMSLQVLD